ncbi:MAG TPA: hypothetical protein DET40_13105 [Lentisphaeria bacterium]|nr:MAG: hypothetical protein A2X45_17415 [Lentisphaerae bacterium GWF2_50_93]HCE44480.1 hypothetical protein [Lentisphaeria bacterium]
MLIMAIALLPMYSSAQTADAGKGSTKIEIESIKYGARPDNLIPVTNKIMDMLKSGVKIKVSSSIVVADPAPGERKYVHIVFLMNGNRTSIKFMDGETFDLSLLQKRLSEVAGQKIEIVTKAAITSSKPVSGQNQQPGKFNPGEFKASVNQAVEMVSMESTDLKVNGIQMLAYSKAFKAISDNPEVEKLMGVDNEWYLNISKMLGEMSKYKLEMEISKERNLTERFDAAKKTYAELCRKFKYLMDHPQKLQKK